MAEDEGASSDFGKASSALKPSEALAFPTPNPDSYRKSNLSCLLEFDQSNSIRLIKQPKIKLKQTQKKKAKP